MVNTADKEIIARVIHEALRAWATANQKEAYPDWTEAPDWMRESSLTTVEWSLKKPDASPRAQHQQWMSQKIQAGWTYGTVKDPELKTHPMLIEYEKLPLYEKQKDVLISAIVRALST